MDVKFKKLVDNAVAPIHGSEFSAGYDLTATSKEYDDDDNVVYGCGLAFEIPKGYVGLVFPRSSCSKKSLILANCVGVIDSDYRGEVTAKFRKTYVQKYGILIHDREKEYNIGERFAQMVIMRVPQVEYKEVKELGETERGEGGYGSTGE